MSGEALFLLHVGRTKMGPMWSVGFLGTELGVPNSPWLWGLHESRAAGALSGWL